ncbi:MAG: LLM class flavin-dependent oxidoreductase, partial [Gemmatimonadetes bacterium]|nr:LLM class flavin-dependent oxidoreductase [Gemmatimonadota bacterium]
MTLPVPPSFRVRASRMFGLLGPWVAVVSLALWSGGQGPWPLWVAAAALIGSIVLGPRGRGPARPIGISLLLAGILVGFFAERQVASVLQDWERYWVERVDEIGDLLSDELDRRQSAGEAASDALIARWTEAHAPPDASVLAEIRSESRSSALALYDAEGGLIALGVTPKPYQKPHPPIWITGGSDLNNVRRVAERGYIFTMFLQPHERIRVLFDTYRERCKELGQPPPHPDRFAYMPLVFTADTEEEALAGAKELSWYLQAKTEPQFRNPPGYVPIDLNV